MDKKSSVRNEKPRLCIATLDPFNGGGVFTVLDFVYFRAKEKYNPSIAYNVLPGFRPGFSDIPLIRFVFGSRPKITNEVVFGMDGFGIQRASPLFEFLNYILNLEAWGKVLEGFDKFFVVGGSNHTATPFALLGKNFSIWIASTLYEDRIDRIKSESLLRKIRDLVSLPPLLILEWYIFKKAKKILTVSNYTKADIVKKYPFVKNKIETVYYPLDTKFFKPREGHHIHKNNLLFTGRISDERKNVRLLLKVFAALVPEVENIKLKLIGGSPTKELLDLCKEFGIEERVEFLGFLKKEDLLLAYQAADLFVIPSFQEGLCISGLEAMSCGVPVVSTKCGGPEDFIKDGINGFLCENDDVADMTKKALLFLKMKEGEREEMGSNARNYVLENHNEIKIWNKLESVINGEVFED